MPRRGVFTEPSIQGATSLGLITWRCWLTQVPVFTVLTDVTNADDDDLVQIRAEWASLLSEVGTNAKGAQVHLVEVNR